MGHSFVGLALLIPFVLAIPVGCDPEAGKGGKAGAGGSSGGKAGVGGDAGDAGEAADGGVAGSSGTAGKGGAGGNTTGGAGSAGRGGGGKGGGSGTGGASGSGGDGGEGEEGGMGGAGGEPTTGEPLVRQVAAGLGFSCALLNSGVVKCWGSDEFGALGDGLPMGGRSPTAVEVVGLRAKKLRAGAANACAILTDDTLRCWGGTGSMQFPMPGAAAAPVSLNGFVNQAASDAGCFVGNAIATGHGCVIDDNDAIGCWGANTSYQLGVTTPATSPEVLFVPALDGYQAVVGGYGFTCGLTLGGGAKCWGDNSQGQLGDGTGTIASMPTATPVDVLGLTSGVKQLAASFATVCALTTAGGVKCWGSPSYGAAGVGEDLSIYGGLIPSPLDVSGLTSGVAEIAGYNGTFCARMEADGSMKCWGYNQNGELGDQPSTFIPNLHRRVPVDVIGVTGTTSIAVGESQTCAALATGGVKCWGAGWASGSDLSTPQVVPTYVRGL